MSTLLIQTIRLALLALTAASLAAQGISAVSVSDITYSSVLIHWSTVDPQPSLIQYGTTPSLGSTQPERTPVLIAAHHQFISGLTGNTTYYYQVCNNVSSCDPAIRSFTTAPPPSSVPALAIPPQRLVPPAQPAVPPSQQFTVAADCGDLQSRINAVARLDGNLDYEILIPAAADCTVSSGAGAGDANQPALVLPAKSGPNSNGVGQIVIR